MVIYKNFSLTKFNTFGLGYKADSLIPLRTEKDAIDLFTNNKSLIMPFLILGGGSNILFTNDFNGTIIYPEIEGYQIEEQREGSVLVSAGAGNNWDDFVEWTVDKGFGGLENLSLIPGKVGATPIQNIGAYGVEVKDTIVSVKTISTTDGSVKIFNNKECEFGYRDSIFKNSKKGKFLVTRVYFELTKDTRLNLHYGSLKEEVSKLGKETIMNVRQAVINIRRSKLPDPEIIGNAGSFFKNPVIQFSIATRLKEAYPEMPLYNDKEGYMKLASGWLIDKCGWKGKKRGNTGVHDKQALVLLNYGKATGKEIYDLSEEIKKSVIEKFGISLEREVEIVGTI